MRRFAVVVREPQSRRMPAAGITQIEIMIANYTRILRDNHTVEPYVVVLTKNVDPRTVQNRLTLKCKPTEGAPRLRPTETSVFQTGQFR